MIRAGGVVTSVVVPVGGWRRLGARGGLVIRGQGGLKHLETLIDIGSRGSKAELCVAGSTAGADVDTGGRIDASGPHAVLLQRLSHIQVLEQTGGVTITRNVNIVSLLKNILQVIQLDKIEALFQGEVTKGIVVAVIDHLHVLHVDVDVIEGVDGPKAPVSKFRYGADVVYGGSHDVRNH